MKLYLKYTFSISNLVQSLIHKFNLWLQCGCGSGGRYFVFSKLAVEATTHASLVLQACCSRTGAFPLRRLVIQLLEHFTTFKAQIKYSLKTSYGQFQVWIPTNCIKCSESPFLFRSTLQLRQEDIEEISNETGFTQPQIERLYHRLTTDLYHQFVTILTFYIVIRFTSLDKSNQGFLTREDFLRFIVLTISGFRP